MRLNQITIPVISVERSILFYGKLGLKLIVKSPEYARFLAEDGEATFSVHQVSSLPEGEKAWIYFEVENPDIKVEELMKEGFVFESLPEDKPWLWREARLRDPDNHLIILYHAGENRINPPWRVR
ncbi:MAG: VOC family protein [Bacteroidia bacterium]|nr:VOC family protein [Bacteroidia bacterium]